MNAPLVPQSQAGSRRTAPGAWRLLGANDPFPFIAVALTVPAVCSGLVALLRRYRWEWSDAVFYLVLIASGVALLVWRVVRLRRSFTRGSEVNGRVTHLQRFAGWEGKMSFPPRWQPLTYVRVVYPGAGVENTAQYALSDEEIARLRPSIGSDVVVIVDHELSQPLLRDVYLDRDLPPPTRQT